MAPRSQKPHLNVQRATLEMLLALAHRTATAEAVLANEEQLYDEAMRQRAEAESERDALRSELEKAKAEVAGLNASKEKAWAQSRRDSEAAAAADARANRYAATLRELRIPLP